ncbi:MAG: lipoyl(octanoyl) transferase LipB, partial [Cyclonatronaceae bacterium]
MNTSTTFKAAASSFATNKPDPVHVCDLGQTDYATAWALQRELQQALIRLKRQPGSPPARQHLLFVEHPHVYTLGKSGKREHLLISEAGLKQRNATFVHIDRGGDITYHGPGQIVGYIIMDLEQHFTDISRYLRGLEEIIIRTLADFGIEAGREAGMTGVWVGGSKICAMGIKCSRWVTMHGFALNLS